jgi:hypothetical protein
MFVRMLQWYPTRRKGLEEIDWRRVDWKNDHLNFLGFFRLFCNLFQLHVEWCEWQAQIHYLSHLCC